jgi:hypothetical protein
MAHQVTRLAQPVKAVRRVTANLATPSTARSHRMNLTVREPGGCRQAVVPFDGITDELGLVKSLIMTLVAESNSCLDSITLEVDLEGADILRLLAIARILGAPGVDRQPLVN